MTDTLATVEELKAANKEVIEHFHKRMNDVEKVQTEVNRFFALANDQRVADIKSQENAIEQLKRTKQNQDKRIEELEKKVNELWVNR